MLVNRADLDGNISISVTPSEADALTSVLAFVVDNTSNDNMSRLFNRLMDLNAQAGEYDVKVVEDPNYDPDDPSDIYTHSLVLTDAVL